eukprot:CAMPEP_0195079818 /NCGR_PEP_ID=MMETSP0448-20130528/21668_1 /TAXON_ID=66468 /ORGANISM="Heterocapsa triquestra, Strain CCMP 448" /LENGTH=64 /DNA_ID=CAMNT_0040112701 /DNA_START=83 /DNA_END=277 /DNA_ORIENTATION=+
MTSQEQFLAPGRECQLPDTEEAALSADLSIRFQSGLILGWTKEGERGSLQSARQCPHSQVLHQL